MVACASDESFFGGGTMGGAFGGLLQLMEHIGLVVQKGARHFLYFLIGDRAYEWSLETIRSNRERFKQQRSLREGLGAAAVAVMGFIILPTLLAFNGVVAAMFLLLFGAVLMGLAQMVRNTLEEKTEREEKSRSD